MALNEADTCREFVTPALQAAGWSGPRLREQYIFTDGRIFAPNRRGERKRADYLLCFAPTFPLAVVEAKAEGAARNGIQQAKDYALILKVHFAYATDGATIIEIDLVEGTERTVPGYPTPEELMRRYRDRMNLTSESAVERLVTADYPTENKESRYYQTIAINRTVEAVLSGKMRRTHSSAGRFLPCRSPRRHPPGPPPPAQRPRHLDRYRAPPAPHVAHVSQVPRRP